MAARDHKDLKLPRKCMVAEEELEGGRDKETRSARLQKCSVAPSSLEKPPVAIMGHGGFSLAHPARDLSSGQEVGEIGESWASLY